MPLDAETIAAGVLVEAVANQHVSVALVEQRLGLGVANLLQDVVKVRQLPSRVDLYDDVASRYNVMGLFLHLSCAMLCQLWLCIVKPCVDMMSSINGLKGQRIDSQPRLLIASPYPLLTNVICLSYLSVVSVCGVPCLCLSV